MYQKETSSFTGPRMHLVMLALPSALRGIIAEEVHDTYAHAHNLSLLYVLSYIFDLSARAHAHEQVRNIKRAIRAAPVGHFLHGAAEPIDPVDDILKALNVFMDWYILAREPNLTISDLERLTELGDELMEELKRVFPERTGGVAHWRFGKFHAVVHVVLVIILFGWSENTSGNWGEHGQTVLLKRIAGLTNHHRHQWQENIHAIPALARASGPPPRLLSRNGGQG